jgi:hypothetical protein
MEWAIVRASTGRPYIKRTWPTRSEARRELFLLLRPYPKSSPWRTELILGEHSAMPPGTAWKKENNEAQASRGGSAGRADEIAPTGTED